MRAVHRYGGKLPTLPRLSRRSRRRRVPSPAKKCLDPVVRERTRIGIMLSEENAVRRRCMVYRPAKSLPLASWSMTTFDPSAEAMPAIVGE